MASGFSNNEGSTTIESTSSVIDPQPQNHQFHNIYSNHDAQKESFSGGTSSSSISKPQVSNLTRTLLSQPQSQQQQQPEQLPNHEGQQHMALHSAEDTDVLAGVGYGSDSNCSRDESQSPFSARKSGAFPQQIPTTTTQNSYNYIPSTHNTPTAICSSYTSNHSQNSSLPSNNFITTTAPHSYGDRHGGFSSSSFRPNTVPYAFPTTTVHTDTAIPNRFSTTGSTFSQPSQSLNSAPFSIPNQFQPPMIHHPTTSNAQQQRIPSSLPAYHQFGQAYGSNPHHQHQQPPYLNRLHSLLSQDKSQGVASGGSTRNSIPIPQLTSGNDQSARLALPQSNSLNQTSPFFDTNPAQQQQQQREQQQQKQAQEQQQQPYKQPEPDHRMTYNEFLSELNRKAAAENGIGSNEEHLNIVDFPVNDLIVMLSCLLTKIIEANDKLHPNHFENTIAIRQKIKEEKKLRKSQKLKRQQKEEQGTVVDEDKMDEDQSNEAQRPDEAFTVRVHAEDGMDDDDNNDDDDDNNNNGDNDDDDDGEDDEMKNKYLANVLAFHGTNIPGISLHAYLARVLKYCPVTNEVFLSLLVYFDRIAKKANNLNQKRKSHAHGNSNNNQNNQNNNGIRSQQGDKKTEHEEEEDNVSSLEAEQLFVMDSYNIHRLIISGITVSSKFFSDIFYKNLRYAKVGGLPLEELNYLELQFLLLLDFKLMISVEELQNYGDLLSRFWKREQVAHGNSGAGATIGGGAGGGTDVPVAQSGEVKS